MANSKKYKTRKYVNQANSKNAATKTSSQGKTPAKKTSVKTNNAKPRVNTKKKVSTKPKVIAKTIVENNEVVNNLIEEIEKNDAVLVQDEVKTVEPEEELVKVIKIDVDSVISNRETKAEEVETKEEPIDNTDVITDVTKDEKEKKTKNEKNVIFKSYSRTFVISFVTIMVTEIIFRILSELSLWSWQMARIGIYALIFSSILSLLIFKCNNFFRKLIYGIVSFGVSTYACVQLGFNAFIGVYASLNTSSQLGAVTDYISDFIKSFNYIYFLCYIPFALTLIYMIFIDRKAKKTKFIKGFITSIVLLLVNVPLFAYSVSNPYFQNKFQTISNADLFRTAANPSLTIDSYGVFGFLFLDVKSVFFPQELNNTFVTDEPVIQEETDYSRIIDDTAWKMVQEDTTNSTFKSLNDYFMNQSITPKNDYTGLFEGKNLIVLLLESTGDLFINPTYFPNFYKMYSEGWTWENHYSPRNSCATMNNEFSGMTSLFSIANNCTANVYKKNTYFESIFGVFNNNGYRTFSAHDYPDDYYYRTTIHPNMGSGAYFSAPKLKMKYQHEYVNWADDTEFIGKILEVIDRDGYADGHFMTWLTTVSAHQPYGVSSITGDQFYSMTDGTGYNSYVRRLYSKYKIQDNALGALLEGLEARGILEDTVIVMYGDHYPYGMPNSKYTKMFDYDVTQDLSIEQTPLVIYTPGMEPQKFEEYTSYINLLPTLANLFNLDYDPRLFVGTDMLSNDYKSLTIFADGTWKNEYAFYNAKTNKIKYYTDDVRYTDEEISKMNDIIQTKIKVSSKAITSNYFNYLEKNLTKKKAELEALKELENEENIPDDANIIVE